MGHACAKALAGTAAPVLVRRSFSVGGSGRARFRRIVRPGDRLDLEVELIASKKILVKFSAKASVEGEMACEAMIWAAIQPVQ